MTIREIRKEETGLLETFLYEAIFQRDPENLLPRDVIFQPELYVYIDGFGEKPQDRCLVAEIDGRVVGAVWTRTIDGYGHVYDGVPEFAISILPGARGMGVGTKLMEAMLDWMRRDGCERTTLAVQKDNYALRMYKKVGFEIIGENDQEYIMECRLQ